jgi:hypothetical protein
MIENAISGAWHARSEDFTRSISDFSISLPTQNGFNVLGSVSISGLAPGANIIVENNKIGGFIGYGYSYIINVIQMGTSGIVITPASVSAPDMQLTVKRCLGMTFRLDILLSDAYALAQILIFSKVPVKLDKFINRIALVADKKDKIVRYAHRELIVNPISPSSEKKFTDKALRTAADILNKRRNDLLVAITDNQKFTSGNCRINAKSGRITLVSKEKEQRFDANFLFKPTSFKKK